MLASGLGEEVAGTEEGDGVVVELGSALQVLAGAPGVVSNPRIAKAITTTTATTTVRIVPSV
jgi:hypothetical protein